MRIFRLYGISLFVLLAIGLLTHGDVVHAAKGEISCKRIVSLAPSITETLFALKLGDNIVGVTKYCVFPPEAAMKSQIGGFLDPNLEAILLLNPSVVILPKEQRELPGRLKALGLVSMVMDHNSIEGILNGIQQLGQVCDVEKEAQLLDHDLRSRTDRIKSKISGRTLVRTMVVVGRGDPGTKTVFVSGNDGFYSDLITLAGGVNVNPSSTISFPIVSAEGIIKVNPEVIFEIVYNPSNAFSATAILKEWQYFSEVAAIKSGRVHVFSEHMMSIPGPRYVDVLEKMAKLIHPEVSWD